MGEVTPFKCLFTPNTICVNCRHFDRQGDRWYDMYCNHPVVRRWVAVHPITGEPTYAMTNDLGKMIYVDDARPHAGAINDGNCEHYKRKRVRIQ